MAYSQKATVQLGTNGTTITDWTDVNSTFEIASNALAKRSGLGNGYYLYSSYSNTYQANSGEGDQRIKFRFRPSDGRLNFMFRYSVPGGQDQYLMVYWGLGNTIRADYKLAGQAASNQSSPSWGLTSSSYYDAEVTLQGTGASTVFTATIYNTGGTQVFQYILGTGGTAWTDSSKIPSTGRFQFLSDDGDMTGYGAASYIEYLTQGTLPTLAIGRPTQAITNTGTAGTTGVTLTAPSPTGGQSPYSTITAWFSNSHDDTPDSGMTQIATPSGGPWFKSIVQGRAYHFRLKVTDSQGTPATAYSPAATAYIPYWIEGDAIYCFGDSHMSNRRAYLEAAWERILGVSASSFTRKGFDQAGANSTEFLTVYHADLLADVSADLATLPAGGKLWIVNGVGFNDLSITNTLSVNQQMQLTYDMIDQAGASNVRAAIHFHTFPSQALAGDSTKIVNLTKLAWDKGDIPGEQGRQYLLNQYHGTTYSGVPIIVIDQAPYEYLVNNQAVYTGDSVHPSAAAYEHIANMEAYLTAPYIRKVLRGESLGSGASSGGGSINLNGGFQSGY